MAEEMAVPGAVFQSEESQPAPPPSLVYSMLPGALQTRLQPLALVRRSLSGYTIRSRKSVTSLFVLRSESDDTSVVRNDSGVTSSCLPNSTEVQGVCWKSARHGKILRPRTLRQEFC